jgi:hypothetical protein
MCTSPFYGIWLCPGGTRAVRMLARMPGGRFCASLDTLLQKMSQKMLQRMVGKNGCIG